MGSAMRNDIRFDHVWARCLGAREWTTVRRLQLIGGLLLATGAGGNSAPPGLEGATARGTGEHGWLTAASG